MSDRAPEFIVARFENERRLVDAVRAVRARGLRVYDAYAPYAIHGLDDAMALRPSRLPLVTLAGGLLGLVSALGLEFYTAVIDWPLNVGGKPDNSLLAFIPIAFELTVLGAGLLTVAAFLSRYRLWPTTSARCVDHSATDDAFVLALRCRQTAFDRNLVERLLLEHGADTVVSKVIEC
jgi:Protein of unknown function (DUF3341)